MAIVRWGSNPDEISDFDRLRQEVNRVTVQNCLIILKLNS